MLMQLDFRCDIQGEVQTRNDANQLISSWAVTDTAVKCFYTPLSAAHGGERKRWRTEPTLEQNEMFYIFFRAGTNINEWARIYNVTDRKGNVLEPGPLVIDSLTIIPGFGGKARHIVTKVRRVEES